MSINERNIFLLDGIGACVSAIFTGITLPFISDWIGLSPSVLFALAAFPTIYAIYSLNCYKIAKTVKPWMLKTIIFGNTLYCFVSTAVMLSFPSLTNWGRLLLIGEIIVLILVIGFEIKIYKKFFRT